MAALIGFRSPRGPQRPSAWRLRIRIKRRITSPWGLLFVSFSSSSLSLFSSSPSPLLFPSSRSSRVRVRSRVRQSVQKRGARTRRKACEEWISSFAYRPIAFLRPVSCPQQRVLQAALPRTFSSLRHSPPFLPFLPFVQRSADRYRVDGEANRGRRFIIQFINHNR